MSFIDQFQLTVPLIQAPMAGISTPLLAASVSEAGGLGSIGVGATDAAGARAMIQELRSHTARAFNVNLFVHCRAKADPGREAAWLASLAPVFAEFDAKPPTTLRTIYKSFADDPDMLAMLLEVAPPVVSFHFGLPEGALLDRVAATGARILSSATTVDEARWLEDRGCHAIIAQGYEAGGHRGMFRTDTVATQIGTLSLVPQVVDAVRVPVIAAGGIADGRGIAAAFMLGASAVQIGTAYLFTPEATIAEPHRRALAASSDRETALTNVFTGRPARGIVNRIMQEVGPIAPEAPQFPLAGGALAPLRSASEPEGSEDFMSLWSGQSAGLSRAMPAGDLTRSLADQALELLVRGPNR